MPHDPEPPDRPGLHDEGMYQAAGYVLFVQTEKASTRDQIWFGLRRFFEASYVDQSYMVHLDVDTTVALTQLQLLRDAMTQELPVEVFFWYDRHWADVRVVYWLRLFSSIVGLGPGATEDEIIDWALTPAIPEMFRVYGG